MNIHFLGTSSGSPSLSRNMSATGISFERSKAWVLVDCAEGTQHQLLKSSLSPYHLSVIAITHLHGDHCYGLPGLIAAIMVSGRTAAVDLIAPEKVIQFVRTTLALTQLDLPFDLRCHAIEDIENKLTFDCCEIEILELKHRVPSYGFRITELQIPRKLRIEQLQNDGVQSGPHYNTLQKGNDVYFNERFLRAKDYTFYSWRPRTVIVCGDNEKPALLADAIKGVDLLIHEATFTNRDLIKIRSNTGHSDALRIAQFAQKHQLPALALFHFSVRYHGQDMLTPLQHEASKNYSGELIFAYDGLVYTVRKHLN
ncbi:ribonuclease Z [Pseudoalteromonas xiamenensis]|uniref:ribonuclease Z n=1 Tax=Pseudoalteromonas xiamenensis TaxID=882626 RepID=UPI0035EE8D1B